MLFLWVVTDPEQERFCLEWKSLKLKLKDLMQNLNFWNERSSSKASLDAVDARGPRLNSNSAFEVGGRDNKSQASSIKTK